MDRILPRKFNYFTSDLGLPQTSKKPGKDANNVGDSLKFEKPPGKSRKVFWPGNREFCFCVNEEQPLLFKPICVACLLGKWLQPCVRPNGKTITSHDSQKEGLFETKIPKNLKVLKRFHFVHWFQIWIHIFDPSNDLQMQVNFHFHWFMLCKMLFIILKQTKTSHYEVAWFLMKFATIWW